VGRGRFGITNVIRGRSGPLQISRKNSLVAPPLPYYGRFVIALFSIPHGLRFVAVPSAYVTVYLGLLNPPRNKIVLSGDYSYGLYLYGFPIQQAFVSVGPNLHHWYLNLLLTIPCAILVAVGSSWLVERPVLDQRKKLRKLEEWYLKKFPSIRLPRFLQNPALILQGAIRGRSARLPQEPE